MFDYPAQWKSISPGMGNISKTIQSGELGHSAGDGLKLVRSLFPKSEATKERFIIFSQSDKPERRTTIEDAAKLLKKNILSQVRFIVVEPEIVCMRFGYVQPVSALDIQYLKSLRSSSISIMRRLGM